MKDFISKSIELSENMAKEDKEKMLNRIGRLSLIKFVGRKDYAKSQLIDKKTGKQKYHITMYRKGYVYIFNDCYGAYPPSGINSLKLTIKELMERFKPVTNDPLKTISKI